MFLAAGHLGANPDVTHRARQIHDDADADAELLAASVKVIAATGDKADFVDFRTRFAAATDPQSEMRYLYALPAFDNEEFISEVADMALSGDIRTQNAPFVLGQALMNKHHGPLVWNRIASSWETVNELFPSNTIVRLLHGIRWLTEDTTADDVAAFFSGRTLEQSQKQLDQHLERLGVNRDFHRRVNSELADALRG